MKISVIIPALNEEKGIERTVQHLRWFGSDDLLEILVIDGGSTDNTVRAAASAGATVLVSPEKGRAAQMNFGAKQSKGEVLYFVHADTIPPETFAGEILKALSGNEVDMGCFSYRFESPSLMLRINSFFTRLPFMFCQGGDKTFFIKRSLFFELGAYDLKHVIMEEYDFLRRARKAGYKLAVLPQKCLVSARKYENNSWLRVQLANMVVYNLWSWNLAHPEQLKVVYRRMLN